MLLRICSYVITVTLSSYHLNLSVYLCFSTWLKPVTLLNWFKAGHNNINLSLWICYSWLDQLDSPQLCRSVH